MLLRSIAELFIDWGLDGPQTPLATPNAISGEQSKSLCKQSNFAHSSLIERVKANASHYEHQEN